MFDNRIFMFVMTLLGSVVGQIFVRMTSLDGSLDKWWLLVPPLSVPPVSIIPAYLIYMNKVKKGHSGYPFDMYMFIPAICTVIVSILLEHIYKNNGVYASIIKFSISFLTLSLALYLRDFDICVKKSFKKSKDIPTPPLFYRSPPTKDDPPPSLGRKSKKSKSLSKGAKAVGKTLSAGAKVVGKALSAGAKVVGKAVVAGAKVVGKVASAGSKAVVKVASTGAKAVGNVATKSITAVKNIKISSPFKRRRIERFMKKLVKKMNNLEDNISYSKIFTQAAILSAIMPFLPYIITWIPYIGSIITSIGGISPLLGILFESLTKMACIMTIYMFINMYNGNNKSRSCNKQYNTKLTVSTILAAFIINILVETGKTPVIPLFIY